MERATPMSTVYIRCEVYPGLFSSEYYVLVNGSSAYYVDKANVKVDHEPQSDKGVLGQVMGYAVEQSENKTLVQLSGEPALGGLRTWVASEDVKAA